MPVDMAPPVYPAPLGAIVPPQSENPLQTAQQMAALRMSPFQQAMAQQQLQGQQLQNQQAQMEIASQQGLMKAYMAAGGDPDKMAEIAPQYHVLPKDIMAVRTNLMNMAKTRAETDKATLDAIDAKHDVLHAAYQPAFDEPDPAKQAQLVSSINQGLLARYPNVKPADLLTYSGPDSLKQAEAAFTTHQWITAQGAMIRGQAAAKQADTAATRQGNEAGGQQAASAQAQRANIAAQLGAAPDAASYDQVRDGSGIAAQFPPSRIVFGADGKTWLPGQQSAVQRVGMTAEQRTQADQAAANAAQNALPKTEPELALIVNDASKPQGLRDAAKAALDTLRQQKLAERPVTNVTVVPGTPQLNGTQLHGYDYLKTLTGAGGVTAAMVQAVDDGRSAMPSSNSRAPYAQPLRAAVLQYNPAFDEANMAARMATLKEFTNTSNGKAGGQVLALNTLIHHADLYQQTAEALKNGTFRPGNAAYNAVANLFGSAPPTQANLVARFLAGETGKVASGGVPAEGEINGVLKNLGSDAGPEQIAGAGNTLLQIAAGRMIPLQERVNKNNLQKQIDVLGPDAREILARRGYDPSTMKPMQNAHVPPAAQAPGAPQYKVGDSVMYQGKPHTITAIDPRTGKLTIEP